MCLKHLPCVITMEVSIIEYYNTLNPTHKKRIRALLEAKVLSKQGNDKEALQLLNNVKLTRKDLIEFHMQTWDYILENLPAESILSKLQ